VPGGDSDTQSAKAAFSFYGSDKIGLTN
jgi:hypothetical protein